MMCTLFLRHLGTKRISPSHLRRGNNQENEYWRPGPEHMESLHVNAFGSRRRILKGKKSSAEKLPAEATGFPRGFFVRSVLCSTYKKSYCFGYSRFVAIFPSGP
jgi:hypothetical protein